MFIYKHLNLNTIEMPMKCLVTFTNILHLATNLFFHIFDQLSIPCLLNIIVFFLFIPRMFEILFTCASIHNANVYEMLYDSQNYFTSGSLMCSHLEQIINFIFCEENYSYSKNLYFFSFCYMNNQLLLNSVKS